MPYLSLRLVRSLTHPVSVLVVEYGYFDNDPAQLEPSSVNGTPAEFMYNVTTVPQPGLSNRSLPIYAAAAVGGGSLVNGMFMTRGAADDYNNWAKLGNPGWSFDDLLPYFIKGTTFQHPSPQLEADFNITWDAGAYGTEGPIHISFAPFQWPGTKHQLQAFVEAGATLQIEHGYGNSYGVYWVPSAVDNTTVTRSYARNGYYDPVQDRTNLQLLTGWRPRGSPDGKETITIKVKKEVVLTAGALHSPVLLQRSGISPARLLEDAGIQTVVVLPGVGSNLQDHQPMSSQYRYNKNVWPNPDQSWANTTFEQQATDAWAQHRSGPLSQTVGNTVAYLPLDLIAPNTWKYIHTQYRAQNASAHLPASYTPSQVAGYLAQRALLADSMTRSDNAAVEISFNGASSYYLFLNKPLSRGTIYLNTRNRYADPSVDLNALLNPLDALTMVEGLRYTRRWHDTDTMQTTFAPVELVPGVDVTTDEALLHFVRSSSGASTGHLSGTCAMMPRELGGVVAPDLTVYGVSGLSVADASVMPLVPGAHTCASVYAVAEKAAGLIKARHQAL
ncbi:hypothetical protein BJX61DRAFT_542888 [Aspergillus egyptiacus]|nr:hypothetical protein BJX61DRAFT_542888 [Aspergillus egyptiacus]